MDKKEKLIKSIEDTEQRLNELKEELRDCDTGYYPKKGEPVLCDALDEEWFGVCLEEAGKNGMVLLYLHGFDGHSGKHDQFDNTYYEDHCWFADCRMIRKLPEIP